MTEPRRYHKTSTWARRAAVLALLLAVLVSGLVPAFAAPSHGGTLPETPADLTPFIAEVYNLILYNSVTKPDPAALAENAIRGMVSGLRDYYAAYYTPDDMADFMTSVQGEFGGIGVRITEDADGFLVVVDVLPGMPAEAAGLQVGDRIVSVNGESIAGEGLEAANRIRGEVGTTVTIGIRREGVEEEFSVELTRALIKSSTVEWQFVGDEEATPKVALIAIAAFDQDTDEEVDAALQAAVAAGAEAFILDLRNNPGGLLDVCERVAERFVPQRHPIIRVNWTWRTEVYKSRERSDYVPLEGIPYPPDGRFPYPVAVLVNGYTASAAEILAATLHEWGVARVFGQKTYGKGSVQSIYSLTNGGGLKVTTATWTSGLGREIEGVGVTPDEIIGAPAAAGPEPGYIPVSDRWVFSRGAVGSDIVNLQLRLNQLGYNAGPEDGVFGLATLRALKTFQSAVGVVPSGVTDGPTVAAINQARIADHPAGRNAGDGGSGGAGDPPPEERPPAPEVTGDQVTDRAYQWLGEQLGAGGH